MVGTTRPWWDIKFDTFLSPTVTAVPVSCFSSFFCVCAGMGRLLVMIGSNRSVISSVKRCCGTG